jgi:hypothetical protein
MSCLPCEKAKLGLQKLGNIVEGYTNLAISGIVKESATEELAFNRLTICAPCTYKAPLVKVAGKQYYTCTECSCPIDAKVRSHGETCPKNKW